MTFISSDKLNLFKSIKFYRNFYYHNIEFLNSQEEEEE